MKMYCVKKEIHCGLIMKLSPLFAKKKTFKRFRSDRNKICLRRLLNVLQDHLIDSIEASKQKYYCRMTNKLTNAKESSEGRVAWW